MDKYDKLFIDGWSGDITFQEISVEVFLGEASNHRRISSSYIKTPTHPFYVKFPNVINNFNIDILYDIAVKYKTYFVATSLYTANGIHSIKFHESVVSLSEENESDNYGYAFPIYTFQAEELFISTLEMENDDINDVLSTYWNSVTLINIDKHSVFALGRY